MARIANRSALGSDSSNIAFDWLPFPEPPVIEPGGVYYPTWTIIGTDYADWLDGTAYGDDIYGRKGDDVIHANDGDDYVFGEEGFDVLYGEQGNDRLFGGADDDMLVGGWGADLLDGGAGNDRASYAESWYGVNVDLTANVASGGDAQGDTFVSIEHVTGSAAHDTLRGNAAANGLTGGAGDDSLLGLAGDDRLKGGSGYDHLRGGAGSDELHGGADYDVLYGEADADAIFAGSGDDYVEGGAGGDYLSGEDGIDMLGYWSSGAGVSVNLDANTASGGDAAGDTIHGFENVAGSAFADVIVGTDGIGPSPESADNRLSGYAGNDQISGLAGNDVIDGDSGNDRMTGGAGADTFRFIGIDYVDWGGNQHTPGHDRITDFQVGVDVLYFNEIGSLADLEFAQVNGNTVITYDNATGSITLVGVTLNQLLQHAQHDLVVG
jgi:Ca2+-binding RTX toxin-like protein